MKIGVVKDKCDVYEVCILMPDYEIEVTETELKWIDKLTDEYWEMQSWIEKRLT